MNDEIREIYLSDLEWTKTHDNMGGAMGNIVFKDNMSYEEYQELFKTTYFTLCDKDYITNLQKENEDYKSRVEKTIELVHDKLDRFDCDGSMAVSMSISYFKEDLLNILQNESDEE